MKIRLANWTLEGIDEIRETAAEFIADLRSPWTLVSLAAALIVAFLFMLPWLSD